MKRSIQNAQCLLSNIVMAQSWLGAVSLLKGLQNCVFLIVSWIDSTTETFGTNLLPSIDHFKFGQQSHFMHDNDPKHTSGLVKHCLKQKTIQTLPCSPFSPNLNPIEKLCDELERRVKKHQPRNLQQLELQLT